MKLSYPKVEVIDWNHYDRLVVIGDIHGCSIELLALLKSIEWVYKDPRVLVVFLGDLIDKGPYSIEVAGTVRDLCKTRSNFKCIQGNHEDYHIRYADYNERYHRTGEVNPVKASFETAKLNSLLVNLGYIKWFRTLPHAITFYNQRLGDSWLLCHSGIIPGLGLDQKLPDFTRNRYVRPIVGNVYQRLNKSQFKENSKGAWPWWEFYKGPQKVVFGHTNMEAPVINDWVYGIDTGCVYGGHLTALCVDDYSTELVQAKAKQVYAIDGDDY